MPSFVDLTGQKFGRLTVIERAENKKGVVYWLCKCECGNMTEVMSYRLTHGKSKSCGCLSKELLSERSIKDLTGQKFGRLTVIERAENKKGKVYWLCKCECGKMTEVMSSSLINGSTNSCGCLLKELLSERSVKDLTGQKFNRLTVIERVENKKGNVYWLCKCACGKEKVVASSSLTSGNTKSCGCLSSETRNERFDTYYNRYFIEDTNITLLARKKLTSRNKTGVNGVFFLNKTGKYRANIGFKRKKYWLGDYDTLEEAAEARRIAEENLHGEFLEWYYETKRQP